MAPSNHVMAIQVERGSPLVGPPTLPQASQEPATSPLPRQANVTMVACRKYACASSFGGIFRRWSLTSDKLRERVLVHMTNRTLRRSESTE